MTGNHICRPQRRIIRREPSRVIGIPTSLDAPLDGPRRTPVYLGTGGLTSASSSSDIEIEYPVPVEPADIPALELPDPDESAYTMNWVQFQPIDGFGLSTPVNDVELFAFLSLLDSFAAWNTYYADGNQITFNTWVKPTALPATSYTNDPDLTPAIYLLRLEGSTVSTTVWGVIFKLSNIGGALKVVIQLVGRVGAVDVESYWIQSTGSIALNEWHNILISFTLGEGPQVYVNDESITLGQANWNFSGNYTIPHSDDVAFPAYTNILWSTMITTYIGPGMKNYTSRVYSAETWFDTTTALDLSESANRRKFIDPLGNPVYLGVNGELPLGQVPNFYADGSTILGVLNTGLIQADWNKTVSSVLDNLPVAGYP